MRALDEFLRWCEGEQIEIDKRLEIRVDPADDGGTGMGVFVVPGAEVGVGETLVRIPKRAILSTRSSAWAGVLPHTAADAEDASLGLALALLLETLAGAASRWAGYLGALPRARVELAVFWGVDGDADGVAARAWVRGTEVERVLCGRGLLDRINLYYTETAEAVLRRLGLASSLGAFYRAYSLVCSRAFLVDAYHGLALVPVADAFNHIEENSVHLESDYDVCASCGALGACAHDLEVEGLEVEDTCDMVTRAPVGGGGEVFNSYEEGLGNAELLCQYGFLLEGNGGSVVSWGAGEVVGGDARTLGLWMELLRGWPSHSGWKESQMVFNGEGLVVNADGQMSHGLWVLLAAGAVVGMDGGLEKSMDLVRSAATEQARVEGLEVGVIAGLSEGGQLVQARVAAAAVALCEARMGEDGSTMVNLLDRLRPDERLSRLAVTYALEERQMLERCRDGCRMYAGSPGQM